MSNRVYRIVGFDYDYHIYNELGKRISSGSGQEGKVQTALSRIEEEYARSNGSTVTVTISEVREVKE